MNERIRFKNVDEYIAALPAKIKPVVKELRRTVKEAAPEAEEFISYNMPALRLHGMLLYYAVRKSHIGLYPYPSAINAFKKELEAYQCSASTVQFPFNKPIPLGLVKKMAQFRVRENLEKASIKKKK